MSSSADFVQYVIDQCSGAGEVMAKKMFGEYGLYCNGTFFGVVCDDKLYVKVTEGGRKVMPDAELRPAYEGARPSILVANPDDCAAVVALVRATCAELEAKTSKKRPRAGK